MRRCLVLAEKGLGQVSPNPMVGCVIVYQDRVIAEGYHKQFGGPHAEVNAIKAVEDESILKDCVLYVNLEPCAHHGKTPPCANLIVEKKLGKVVIGQLDPYPEVEGKGVEILKSAGIEVEIGILEKECQQLNKRFLCNQVKHRPYVILKWAESADGFIGQDKQVNISGVKSRELSHLWRTQEDAFLVGTNTLLIDNPQLNARLVKGRNPIRIAMDFDLKSIDLDLHFFKSGQRSILLNGKMEAIRGDLEFHRIEDRSVASILNKLWSLKIGSVVVEGGSELLRSFINSGLYDEIRVFRSKDLHLKQGIKAPEFAGELIASLDMETDILSVYK